MGNLGFFLLYRSTASLERSDEIPASTPYTPHPTPQKKRKQPRTTGANNITPRLRRNIETLKYCNTLQRIQRRLGDQKAFFDVLKND